MIPSIDQAHQMLAEAGKMNPGPWTDHSLHVAAAACAISEHHPDLDPERAYVCGCLHDIGRRFGIMQMRHILEGYRFLEDQGYPDPARICLTHSFPIKDVRSCVAQWDCSDEDKQFVQSFLDERVYDGYDRLLQLCDGIALPHGCVLIEKRMVDVVLRYGTNDYVADRWRTVFEIKASLEEVVGRSIYDVLPDVVENTFSGRAGIGS